MPRSLLGRRRLAVVFPNNERPLRKNLDGYSASVSTTETGQIPAFTIGAILRSDISSCKENYQRNRARILRVGDDVPVFGRPGDFFLLSCQFAGSVSHLLIEGTIEGHLPGGLAPGLWPCRNAVWTAHPFWRA